MTVHAPVAATLLRAAHGHGRGSHIQILSRASQYAPPPLLQCHDTPSIVDMRIPLTALVEDLNIHNCSSARPQKKLTSNSGAEALAAALAAAFISATSSRVAKRPLMRGRTSA